MSSLIGALRVTLGIDTAAFSSGLAKAESVAKTRLASITKGLVAFASGVGIAAVYGLAQRSLEFASSLGEVAQQLGVSTKELQEYRYAASQAGIEQDVMDKALQKLTRTIGQAVTGGKSQSAVFKALGIDLRNTKGEVISAGEAIPLIAEALSKIPDPARRAAVETQLFGRAGQQLDTLLAGGSAAVNELRDAAHELGLVLSDKQIQSADETADKLSAMKQVLEARIAGTVADNANSILALADALSQLVVWAGKAASAYRVFKLTQGQITEDLKSRGFAGTAETRAMHARNANRYRAAIAQELGTTDNKGGFRDDRSIPIPGLGLKPSKAGNSFVPNLDNISGGGGGARRRGGGGRSAQDAIRDRQRIEDDNRDLQLDELRARQDLVYDIKGRGVLAQQMLELEQQAERAQIEHQVELGDMTRTEADKQLASLATVHTLQREKLVRDEQYDILQEQFRQEDAISDLGEGRLRLEADLARTARERREIENRILDHKLQEERNAAQRVLDDPRASPEQKTVADRRLLWLDQNEGGLRAQVNRQNMTPLEVFFDKLPKSAAQANEALEEVAAGGLGSIIDGLADAAVGARSLGDVFKNVARQIIADLIRIQIQRAIVSGLSSVLGGIGGGAKVGAVDTSGAFAAPSLNFARGGAFRVSGNPGVDTNILSINGRPSARVSAGETVAVIPNNRGGGRGSPISFDLRGAVMTHDLVAQMQQIAAATGGAAAMAGGQMGEGRVMARARRTIR